MGKLAAVTKVDNQVIGGGKVGPMTTRLSEHYAELTAHEGVQVAELYRAASSAAVVRF